MQDHQGHLSMQVGNEQHLFEPNYLSINTRMVERKQIIRLLKGKLYLQVWHTSTKKIILTRGVLKAKTLKSLKPLKPLNLKTKTLCCSITALILSFTAKFKNIFPEFSRSNHCKFCVYPKMFKDVTAPELVFISHLQSELRISCYMDCLSKIQFTFSFAISKSPIIHLVCPPEFWITFVSHFSWVSQSSQEKLKTTYAKFWGADKVYYGGCGNGELFKKYWFE